MVKNYAVQFGQQGDLGMKGGAQAWPFIYTFINSNNVDWDRIKGTVGLPSLGDIGPIVPAGGLVNHNVLLDPDFLYKLLYIQYTVYAYTTYTPPRLLPPVTCFAWHDPVSGLWVDPTQPEASVHHRLDKNVRINVQFQPQGRYMYGQENQREQVSTTRNPMPLSIFSLQGYEYGPSYCRTPVLLPQNGQLHFEMYNDNAEDVVVGACIYGMKVRL